MLAEFGLEFIKVDCPMVYDSPCDVGLVIWGEDGGPSAMHMQCAGVVGCTGNVMVGECSIHQRLLDTEVLTDLLHGKLVFIV